MGVVVIVPVLDQPAITQRFLASMREQEFDELFVLDNGCAAPTKRVIRAAADDDERITSFRLPKLGIYGLWNAGYELAVEAGASAVLVSNNDVVLPAGAVELLAANLAARRELVAIYPDYDWPWASGVHPRGVRYGTGVMRDGGLYGPCFLVATDRVSWSPLVSDEEYEWWYGDDHLSRQISEEGGKLGRLVGVPVLHDNEGTARHHPKLAATKLRDRRRWLDSQRRRLRVGSAATRRMPPGTRVWRPGGAQRNLDE